MDEPTQSVLKRKAARARGPDAPIGPAKALERALTRVLREELDLDVAVTAVAETSPDVAGLLDGAEANALLALAEGADGGAGLCALSAPVMAALIAQRVTGRLPVGRVPEQARAPTRVDIEMVRDVLDDVLVRFAAALGDTPSTRWARGYRYRGAVSDPRLLQFALPDVPYRGLRLDLSLAGGAVAGFLFLALPDVPDAQQQAGAAPWGDMLAARVMGADVTVGAVMPRISLPLAQIRMLKPGDVLPLAPDAIGKVRLEAPGRSLVAVGRLGRSGRDLAVRVETVVAPAGAAPHTQTAPGTGQGAALDERIPAPDPAALAAG